MKSVLDGISEEVKKEEVSVLYIGSLAFSLCECGFVVTMAQRVWGNSVYDGRCRCGKEYNLNNGKMRLTDNAK